MEGVEFANGKVFMIKRIMQKEYLSIVLFLGKTPSTFLFLDTLENRLARRLPVQSHQYEVCSNGCELFQKNDTQTTSCPKCKPPRYTETNRPVRQMKMFSIGDQIARLLSNKKTRDLMKYRSNYRSQDGVYKDVFDGKEYKDLKENTDLFSGEDDVALALFVDGFSAGKNHNGHKLAILHVVNMNIPPEHR